MPQESKPLYIKARRHKTIVFLCFQSTDTVLTIKTNLSAALQGAKAPNDIRLLKRNPDTAQYIELDDDQATASAAGIVNDMDIYFVFNNDGTWEDLHTEEYESLDVEDEDMPVEQDIPPPSSTKKEKGKGRA